MLKYKWDILDIAKSKDNYFKIKEMLGYFLLTDHVDCFHL